MAYAALREADCRLRVVAPKSFEKPMKVTGIAQLVNATFVEPAAPQAGSFKARERVMALLRYLRSRLADPPRIKEMAEKTGVSVRTFQRNFQGVVGKSPQEFICEERMHLAAKLLRNPSLPIGEVGRRIGMPDEASFSRSFSSAMGVSPRQYRKNHIA